MSGAVKPSSQEYELQHAEGLIKFEDGVFYLNKQQRESTRINNKTKIHLSPGEGFIQIIFYCLEEEEKSFTSCKKSTSLEVIFTLFNSGSII